MNKLVQPNQLQIMFVPLAGENAFPATSTVPMPGELKTFEHGGLSKLEWMATHILAGMFATNANPDTIKAVHIAECLLRDCGYARQRETKDGS